MKKFFLFVVLLVVTFFLFTSFTSKSDDDLFLIASQKLDEYNVRKKDYVIIVDYTKPIGSNRLYVLDMKTKQVVITSTVSHSFKSGLLYPTDFSNVSGTNKSSKGAFLTKGTYNGGFGYSMIIRGLDKGVNDNVESRKIIFHSTEKMSNPWSNGCFATPKDVNEKIIDLTKNGTLVYVITE
jgi:hypothetical protein